MPSSMQMKQPRQSKLHLWWRSLLLLGVLGAIAQSGFALLPSPAMSSPAGSGQGSLARPQPPSTPPPNGTRSGGSLGGSDACGNVGKPLVAMIPIENPVFTTSAHPTLLVYVPYDSGQVSFGEFSVLVGVQETTRLYHTRFTLPTKPGIVSISLPNLPTTALQKDVFYHWYFKLYCQSNFTSKADLGVDGWVKRVALTSTQQPTNAATPVIWYDALSDLADRLQTSPQNNELKVRWRALLELIHAADLASEPLVGSVTLLAE